VSRDALLFLEDIEKSCIRIVRYTEDRSRDEVFSDEIRFDAVLFNLQILGEAIKKLPFDLRQRYPEVPWREIAGLRDFVAHAYFALDLEILWNAIQEGVPALLVQIRGVIANERKDPGPLGEPESA
jgi:uncharacterized protein with HEPN domain